MKVRLVGLFDHASAFNQAHKIGRTRHPEHSVYHGTVTASRRRDSVVLRRSVAQRFPGWHQVARGWLAWDRDTA